MRWVRVVAAAVSSAGTAALGSQAPPPGTDIFLASLASHGGRLELGAARNLTARPGYDNQPCFSPNGRVLYYTSIRDDGQADTYRLDLRSVRATRFTETPESEYSPAVMPGGRELAVVRVERDSTQRLWAFPLRDGGRGENSGNQPRLLLERVKPVGYQAWADDHTVLLYVLGSPATLQLADTRTGQARVLASDIGRSLHQVPGPDIRGHHNDYVFEIHRVAQAVSELPVFEHLQQDVEHIRMRLLDFIQQHH